MTRLIRRGVMFLVCVGLGAAAGVAAPTTRATDLSAPKAALKAYGDALPDGGTKAALRAYHWDNDAEKKAADAMAESDVAAARLEQLARQKFGPGAAARVVLAMRREGDEAIAAAKEKIEGDLATLEWADGAESLEMIKVKGKWKIRVAGLLNGEGDDAIDESIDLSNDLTKAYQHTIEEIEAGAYANAFLLERAVKQRTYAVLGEAGEDDEG